MKKNSKILKIINEEIQKVLSERPISYPTSDGGVHNPGISASDLIQVCENKWNAPTLKKCLNSSVRGLPSIIQIVKAISKDKDILAVLSLMGNKDFITIVHKGLKGEKVEKSKGGSFTLASAHSELHESPLSEVLKDAIKNIKARWANRRSTGNRILTMNWNALRESASKGNMIKALKRIVKDEIRHGKNAEAWQGFAMPEGHFISAGKMEQFINFWGFCMLLEVSSTLVHELAHIYDPDNPWNLSYSYKELDQRYGGTYGTWTRDGKKYPGKDSEAMKATSGRAEMFATNRQKDYINDLLSSSFLKSVLDPMYGRAPVKSPTFEGIDLSKFAVSSWVARFDPKDIKDERARRNWIATKKRDDKWDAEERAEMGKVWHDTLEIFSNETKLKRSGKIKAIVTAIKDFNPVWYSKHCSLRLNLVDGEDLAGYAQGEHEDRLAPHSIEDRKEIIRTRREMEKLQRARDLARQRERKGE